MVDQANSAIERVTELSDARLDGCKKAAKRLGFTADEREQELASEIEHASLSVPLSDLRALIAEIQRVRHD